MAALVAYDREHYIKNIVPWREKNKEKVKQWNRDSKRNTYPNRRKAILKSRYGITVEQFDKMFNDQNGCCAICGVEYHLTMHIDHCHTTNKIRGLLCNNCNRGLGHFKDNEKILQTAIEYLKKSTSV